MYKKIILKKFEWENVPPPLNSMAVENLIYNSTTENFAAIKREDGSDLWAYFTVLQNFNDYRLPQKIIINTPNGGIYERSAGDFILFNDFSFGITPNYKFVRVYKKLIGMINDALEQHINASQLVANIAVSNGVEQKEYEKIFKDYKGIKITKRKSDMLDTSPIDFIQFSVNLKFLELEHLKHDLEDDLLLRVGVSNGIDKSHITDTNLRDSEQSRDLINSFDLSLRENFCARWNDWAKPAKPLLVKIHQINYNNAIRESSNAMSARGGVSDDD